MHMSAAIRVSRLSRSHGTRARARVAVERVVRNRKSEDGQPASEVIASRHCAHMRCSAADDLAVDPSPFLDRKFTTSPAPGTPADPEEPEESWNDDLEIGSPRRTGSGDGGHPVQEECPSTQTGRTGSGDGVVALVGEPGSGPAGAALGGERRAGMNA